MKPYKLIITSILLVESCFATLEAYAPLKENTSLFKSSILSTFEEREYERNQVPIDKITKKGNAGVIEYSWSNSSNYEFTIELDYLFGGDFQEKYQGELSNIPNKETDTSGIKEPLFRVRKWLPYKKNQFFKHALEISLRPKLFEPKASDYAEGRNITTLNYLFSYHKKGFEIAGDIYSRLYGKRELTLPDGLVDETKAYSEVGFILNPGYIFTKNSAHLILGYSSTTNYNTSNTFYTRESDKGFIWHYGVKYKHQMTKKDILEFSAHLKTTTFNSIEEDPTRDVEFKIFERFVTLKWWKEI